MVSSLYAHLPFCLSICSYCDFTKLVYNESWAFSYVEELKKDIARLGARKFSTIYIGGGTPTSLSPRLLDDLLSALSPHLSLGGEWSIESNPESLDEEKLAILLRHGVNRLSLGGESSNPRILKEMGRRHDFLSLQKAVTLARSGGLSNINVDLIYAWPKETKEELERDISAFLSLKVPHLSAYSLILEDSTILSSKGIKEEDEDKQGEEYETILQAFRAQGYKRYEVSNFAFPGFECRHNLTYWKDNEYVGMGLGASGYENGIHYQNTKSLSEYLKGKRRVSEEPSSLNDDLETYFLTNLRLSDGFSEAEFLARFGFSFLSRFSHEAAPFLKEGLLIRSSGRVFCSDKGLLLLDKILVGLIIDL